RGDPLAYQRVPGRGHRERGTAACPLGEDSGDAGALDLELGGAGAGRGEAGVEPRSSQLTGPAVMLHLLGTLDQTQALDPAARVGPRDLGQAGGEAALPG